LISKASSNPPNARCTRYKVMWYRVSVIRLLHQWKWSERYNGNIVESGVNHHNHTHNPSIMFVCFIYGLKYSMWGKVIFISRTAYGIVLPTLHSGVLETKCSCSKFIFQIMLFSKTVYNTATFCILLLFEVDHGLKISVVAFNSWRSIQVCSQ
jgi:hypothetical protein